MTHDIYGANSADKHTYALPTFYTVNDRFEREIIQVFHHCFNVSAQNRVEIRILSSIHKVADIVGHGDDYVAKILVDHGLMAGRLAFPQGFLDHIEFIEMRQNILGFDLPRLSESLSRLTDFWHQNDDDPWVVAKRHYGQGREFLPSLMH